MPAGFTSYLLQHAPQLSETELGRIESAAEVRQVYRNDFLFREGDICRHKIFVVNGLLRTYSVGNDGSEHIVQFNPENTWAIDAESYDNQVPSKYNLAAVEESELLLWKRDDFNKLLNDIPQLKIFAGQLISRAVYNGRERLLTALSATPEEKYTEFLRMHPDLISRLPLWMIASYLGISLKTLTRIRHAQLQRS